MPGLDLCAAGICRTTGALLFEKRHQAAAAQGRLYLGRGAVTKSTSSRLSAGTTTERHVRYNSTSALNTVSSGHSPFQRFAFAAQFTAEKLRPRVAPTP